MAPALTEPLSPTNKLSSSAASASPRPTAAASPLQNNTNNHTNNVDSVDDHTTTTQTISNHNKNPSADVVTGVLATATTTTKGAFQLAFEQSVAGRKNTPHIANGDTQPVNIGQMGPMCDPQSSQPPQTTINSTSLIKPSPQIDPETAAKIITSQFEEFPSDIEEAITAEICLKQKLKSNQENQERDSDESNVLSESQKPMDNVIDRNESQAQPSEVAKTDKGVEKDQKPEEKTKINIISVQELPPVKTDSTVTASEDDNLEGDDNIEERLKQLDSTEECHLPISQGNSIPTTPTRSTSAQMMVQLTPTNNIPTTISMSSLTPQSMTSTMGGSSGTQKDFKDNTSEMDHDIDEDLLQVLKGLDATSGGDLCDFAGLLSEYAMNYEDVNPPNAKDNPLREVQAEIEKNQQTMKRKIDFLCRRLRKLQSRYMSKQASEEISGLFEWSARTTKRKDSDSDHQQLTFAEEKYHPVSTITMRNVLKKIESVATNAQHISPLKKVYPHKVDPSTNQTEVVVPIYDDKVTEEIGRVCGLLQSEMREVQSAMDSDATASSSGGESADEMVTYNNQIQDPLPISKRAAWRYSRDRAFIASRWSWLLSQISDLEFRIRQLNDLYQKLRQRKCKVNLCGSLDAAGASATGESSSVNGYRGTLPGSGSTKATGYTTADDTDLDTANSDAANDPTQGACRTRAFLSTGFRKRKLFQTANVHTISKKAARPSTIKCGCQWPLHPCALCTGRSDPTAPRDLPDTMMMSQRVALLDPGYHPVLSFPEDVSNSIYLEAISRDPDWQNRVIRSTAKSVMKGALAAQRAAEREEQRGAYATSGRITPSTPHVSSTTSTGKRKYTKRNHHQDIHGGGSHSTTPLVANKLGKSSKKYHRHRSLDYNHHHRKNIGRNNNSSNSNNGNASSSHHHLMSSHPRSAEQSNHHPAHSSSIYQHSKNNKIRKLSSASAAAVTLNQSGSYHYNSNNTTVNSSHHHLSSQQHQSYNNELNFLHCDSLDGATTANGLMRSAGRSRTSSPTHGGAGGHHRSLERKSRSSYDIDNIVIPYSVAAATRVEVIPYKEIPTPKWRIIDYDAEDTTATGTESTDATLHSIGENLMKESDSIEEKSENLSPNLLIHPKRMSDSADIDFKGDAKATPEPSLRGSIDMMDEEEGDEDISDEAMILRHERALIEERRKFQTFMKFPWSTRSRANRRLDSRTESSGANTPDPTSAPHTPIAGGDQESIPSPFGPSTPLTPLESISETGENANNMSASAIGPPIMNVFNSSFHKRQERRRTVSAKRDKEDLRRSSTPDPRELIPPYEPLAFPIPDDLFESMLRMMPPEYPPPQQEDCPKPIKSATTTTATATIAATTITNGLADNTTSHPIMAVPLKSNICDQKLNNSKHAFVPLKNNQKQPIEHITGEDDIVIPIMLGGQQSQLHHHHPQQQSQPPPVLMGAPAPVAPIQQQPRTKEEIFMCRNNLLGCSDTESIDSETGDDDPNDPEWKEEEPE